MGIAVNPYSTNVAKHLIAAAAGAGLAYRVIDLPSLVLDISADGLAQVSDRDGPVTVDCLAPYLLYGFPAAAHALRALARAAYAQNPVDAVLVADDKAATAQALAGIGVPQVPTRVCAGDPDLVAAAARRLGYPVVLKRTHGAQGRWVRRAADPTALAVAYAELMAEGPGALIVQRYVVESEGTSVRAIVTGGRLVASTRRTAAPPEWRSNVAAGARQVPVDLTGP
jgi:RimK family alpha-L-glutamate ligase